MAILLSGIVIFGMLLISVFIYALCVGWYASHNRLLSSPATSNEPVKKIECSLDRSLKPDLITFNYKKENHNDEEASNCETNTTARCMVCLRGLENEEVVRQLPKCEHIFHAPCIDTWFGSHSGCPLCRTLIDRLPSDDNSALTPHDDQEKNFQRGDQ